MSALLAAWTLAAWTLGRVSAILAAWTRWDIFDAVIGRSYWAGYAVGCGTMTDGLAQDGLAYDGQVRVQLSIFP